MKLNKTLQLTYRVLSSLLLCGLFIIYLLNYFNLNNIAVLLTFISLFIVCNILIWSTDIFKVFQNRIFGYIIVFSSPIVLLFIVERFNENYFWNINNLSIWLNILIITLIILLLYLISNNIKVTLNLILLLFYLFALINYFVYSFRGKPILAADVSSVSTAMIVANNYTFSINENIIVITLFSIFQILIFSKIDKNFKLRWNVRFSGIVCYVIIVFVCYNIFYNTKFIDNKGIIISSWDPQASYKANGTLLGFMVSSKYVKISKPEGYSLDAVDEIISSYNTVKNNGSDSKSPNVIVIMNESFADLSLLGDLKISEDYMPFMHNLVTNTVKGNLYVSVYGGNTPNSEFEFLTGNSTAFLPIYSIPYTSHIKSQLASLVYTLKSQGYIGNVAIHPFNAEGWSRTTIYPLLGFEKFISIEDFLAPEYVRNYITDSASFKKVIETYERARTESDKPFFAFNVTMQNHGGYSTDYENLSRNIKLLGEQHNDQVERYINLAKMSDEAFEELVNYFAKIDEDTVILFFGDHQPALPEEFYESINSDSKEMTEELANCVVPFVLWTNFDIESKVYDRISINYLSSILLDTINVRKTGYNEFLLDISKQIPVITPSGYYGKEGKFYRLNEESPYENILKKYEIIQYNNMFDNRNRRDNFFYIYND